MIKWDFQRISKYEYQLKSDLPVSSDSIFLRSLSSKLSQSSQGSLSFSLQLMI